MKTAISGSVIIALIGFWLVTFGSAAARAQTTNTNTCISPLNSDFVTKYEILEEAGYLETNLAGPVPNGTNAFVFEAIIKLATNLAGTASSAVLTIPGAGPTLMNQTNSSEFIIFAVTNAFTNITSTYPDGTYQFTIFDNTIEVSMPADSVLPNAPTLSNFAADQSINANADFTLQWNAFNTGGVLDFISVRLTSEYDDSNAFKTGDFGCPGALDGTASSILIPANTLFTNTAYRAEIEFIKVYTFDTNSIPGAALLAGTVAVTEAKISTGSASVATSALVLTNAALVPGGGVRFDLTTTPGTTYAIQFNPNLNNLSGWTPLLTTNALAGLVSFTNSPVSGTAAGYYRALQQ
jgi:hypothetical protein